jgi:hypothetical protein
VDVNELAISSCHQRVGENGHFRGMGDMGIKGLAEFPCHHIVERSFLGIGYR